MHLNGGAASGECVVGVGWDVQSGRMSSCPEEPIYIRSNIQNGSSRVSGKRCHGVTGTQRKRCSDNE